MIFKNNKIYKKKLVKIKYNKFKVLEINQILMIMIKIKLLFNQKFSLISFHKNNQNVVNINPLWIYFKMSMIQKEILIKDKLILKKYKIK